MSRPVRYHPLSMGLHWLMAVLILTALGVGLSLDDMALSPLKMKLINWHKWMGVSVLILVAVRLAWRHIARPPALPDSMAGWQRRLAELTHGLLYALMVAIPLSGWAMSSAKGFPVVYLGLFPLPDLVQPDEALGDTLKALHTWLNYGLIALLAGHIGAALKHHLIDRDDILTRMLPFGGRAR